MDYFDTTNSPREAELAYANWYYQLPDQRKAQMLCDFYEFGVESVKYNERKKNPFATEADLMFRFMELNTKESYKPEIFSFIQEKMKEKSEQEWKDRFRQMKEELGWTYEEVATYIGAKSSDSVKSTVSRKLPAFAKLAVCVYEHMKQ